MCIKVRHPTMAAAEMAVKKMEDATKLNAYYCVACKGYHVGHKSRRKYKHANISSITKP